MKTYQDLLACNSEKDIILFMQDAVAEHKASDKYRRAKAAGSYYDGENVDIMAVEKVVFDFQGRAHKDMFAANHKIPSNFFRNVVDQEVSYLLGNGIGFENEGTSKALGMNFSERVADALTYAAVDGVCFGFWNKEHLDVLYLTDDGARPGFVPLYDEESGALRSGIRYWRLDDSSPIRMTLFEEDGATEYIKRKDKDMEILTAKKPYKLSVFRSQVDGEIIMDGSNYPSFPIVPLRYNAKERSELDGKRYTVAALDLVTSNMVNNISEADLIYWVLTNCHGMTEADDMRFIEALKTTHVVHADGDDGAKAEAHSIDAPYAATKEAAEMLTKRLYTDFQAFDPESVSAGNQTATAIKAAYVPLDLKSDKTERRVTEFVRAIMALAGVSDDNPTYTRNQIINKTEETQNILMGAEYYDDEYVTRKLLTINGDADQADEILRRKDAEGASRFYGGTSTPEEEENDAQVVFDGVAGFR